MISQNVLTLVVKAKYRDEGRDGIETYPPGSTVLIITVFNQRSRNTGDDGTNDSQAPNNLEFFHHILG